MQKSHPVYPIPHLVKQRMKEKGLSRSQLVQAIGYSNITKGLRRLDHFPLTLQAPDEFITGLLSVLEIDGLTFHKSLMLSRQIMLKRAIEDSKRTFRPYSELVIEKRITPWFAAHLIRSKGYLDIPEKLLSRPLHEELDAVATLVEEHIKQLEASNYPTITRYKYHRSYNAALVFNRDNVLCSVEFKEPELIRETLPLGNRFLNLFAGSMRQFDIKVCS